jgi:putative nucleotidyltransferase with HDIG domain
MPHPVLVAKETHTSDATRWEPRPGLAALLRAFALIAPIAASVAFVHVASRLISPPGGGTLMHVAWWVGLSAAATVVLIGIDRLTRRLLPLTALLKLALVFPDEAPSRFRTALGSGTTEDLEQRLEQARHGAASDTPVEAAERLLGFVAALSAHDRITRGHSERVRAYSQMIANELRLSRDEVDRLNWAALLHDVGKLEVPTEILNKAGRPTDEEWQFIRSHPELGARLAEPLRAWLGEWADAISDHHERWDGKGYPKGTERDDISLAGRIVAVADVFDVITSARSYKEPGNATAARDEIARCSGAQFDPRVVRAFLSVSLGRLRFAMGPLSWLAQAPVLGRIPLSPGIATVASSAVAVVGSVAAGIVGFGGQHATPSYAAATRPATTTAAARVVQRIDPAPLPAPLRHGGAARAFAALTPAAAPALQLAPAAAPAPATIAAAPQEVPAAADPPADDPPPVDPPGKSGPFTVPPALPPAAPVPPPAAPPPPAPFVNHAPAFTAGGDQAGVEDSGPQTIAPWAQSITAGPSGEGGQSVSFTVSNSAPSLFTAGGQPAIAPDGTLTYTPAPDASGSATVSVHAVDDGGTADGGSDTSAVQTFQIVVASVNDAPGFTGGADQSVFENAAAQTVGGWASAITRGAAGESGQVVSFAVTNNATALFTAGGQPAVAANGTLTFTPATGAHGAATITVRAVDDGGTARAGVDTSPPQTFAITVVNQAPTGNDDAPSVLENSLAGVTFNVLANDTDPETDALSLASYDDSPLGNGALTDNGGGSFTYVPATHFAGTDTFSYTLDDGNGGTSTAVVTITVTAVPDPPAVADDAYVVAQSTSLVEPAPGVLANDGDSGGGVLLVDTTPVAGPANGVLGLAADGSFTYTPTLGFAGSDSFSYRATSVDTGLDATGVVTITVSATFSTSLLYLGTSGPTSELWNLTAATPASEFLGLVPDYDGDLAPGLTIDSSNGDDTGDARRSQTWRYPLASPLVLNGPVTLHLSSAQSGGASAYAYIYDCTAGGASCTQIGFGSVSDNPWNGLLQWGQHDISLGTVNRTLAATHELRMRLYAGGGDQRVALTLQHPTSLTLTTP